MKPFLLLLLLAASPVPAAVPNQPVAQLDLARYSGEWHEIARLPMYFQRNCVGEVTARYTVQTDATVEVRNSCRIASGKRDMSVGVAKAVPGRPGALKVRFAPGWLSWAPFAWADYWVIALDPDYKWAIVGGPSKKYLWLLSREKTLPPEQLARLVDIAARAGYPTSKLIRSETGQLRED